MICSGQNILPSDSEAAIEMHYPDPALSLVWPYQVVPARRISSNQFLVSATCAYGCNAQGAHGFYRDRTYVEALRLYRTLASAALLCTNIAATRRHSYEASWLIRVRVGVTADSGAYTLYVLPALSSVVRNGGIVTVEVSSLRTYSGPLCKLHGSPELFKHSKYLHHSLHPSCSIDIPKRASSQTQQSHDAKVKSKAVRPPSPFSLQRKNSSDRDPSGYRYQSKLHNSAPQLHHQAPSARRRARPMRKAESSILERTAISSSSRTRLD